MFLLFLFLGIKVDIDWAMGTVGHCGRDDNTVIARHMDAGCLLTWFEFTWKRKTHM